MPQTKSFGWSKSRAEQIENIKKLHKTGFSNKEIAKKLGITRPVVVYRLKLLNLKSNGTIRQRINIIDEKNAKCSKCEKIRPLDEFLTNRRGQKYEYKFSYCNSCRRKQLNNALNRSMETILKNKWNRLLLKCKKDKIPIDFDYKYLVFLYKKQKGLCFYTKEKMICKYGAGFNKLSLSIDKIIPELGYIKGNTVLCTRKANTIKSDLTMKEMKKWLTPWYKKIVKYIESHKNNVINGSTI